MRYFFVIVLFTFTLFALSIEELKKMPKGIERDYFIWRFLLEKNTTKEEALKIKPLLYHINSKLQSAYYAKTHEKLKSKSFYISSKTRKKYQKIISSLLKNKNFYKAWLKLPPKQRLLTFNLMGKKNRAKLNFLLPQKYFYEMSKYYAINEFIYRSFREPLENLQKTLINYRPNKNNKITYKNLIFVGLKAIQYQEEKAKYYFYAALLKAKNQFDIDKAYFWLYMATKNKKYLHKIAKSKNFNIYKLIALDWLNLPYPKPLTIEINKEKNIDFNTTNPIAWAKLKEKIFSSNTNLLTLAQQFKSKKTIAIYTYILSKASKDTKDYFIIPYKEFLSKYPIQKQALILAIARQESRFIPSAISRSFALGLMQFMPFLIKDIAKKKGIKMQLEDIFNPYLAIDFASYHIDYLHKYLYNPLFVAYAYNAGIGYTRRMLKRFELFNIGKYEPYLSLELLDNEQANEYGKKVLANYVVYRMLLGKSVKITTILNKLLHPTLSDSFRKSNIN